MATDVVGGCRIGVVENVCVAIRRTSGSKVWVGLSVTHGHTEPECGVELEVERSARTVLLGESAWIRG
jgi:hypothetical protein